MRATGRLDDRITIKALSVTQGDFGEVVESYSTHATVWAHVMFLKGDEKTQNGREITKQKIEILIRYCDGLNETMKIEHDSRTYDIESISINGRKESMLVRCEEVN